MGGNGADIGENTMELNKDAQQVMLDLESMLCFFGLAIKKDTELKIVLTNIEEEKNDVKSTD